MVFGRGIADGVAVTAIRNLLLGRLLLDEFAQVKVAGQRSVEGHVAHHHVVRRLRLMLLLLRLAVRGRDARLVVHHGGRVGAHAVHVDKGLVGTGLPKKERRVVKRSVRGVHKLVCGGLGRRR